MKPRPFVRALILSSCALVVAGAFVECVGDTTVTPLDGGSDTGASDNTLSDGPGANAAADALTDAEAGPSGVLDPSFKQGLVTGVTMSPYAVTVDAQKRIYVAGSESCTAYPVGAAFSNTDFAVARFLSPGDVDTSYGSGGRACVSILDAGASIDD